MSPSTEDYLKANRALWNEWAGIHARSDFYDLENFRMGGVRLRPFELQEVGHVEGKDMLHLQCHIGTDTLSWARLGARVTGVDFSAESLGIARDLARDTGLDVRFIEADLYDLPGILDGAFDVVYTSRGTVCWLPDVPRWAQVAARFVKPGGFFYILDLHPVIYAFEDEDPSATEPRLKYPYFAQPEPLVITNTRSYADARAPVKAARQYDWTHTLGEIVTSLIEAGLRIEFLHEWPFLEWGLPWLEKSGDVWVYPGPGELPLSFSLKASKPA